MRRLIIGLVIVLAAQAFAGHAHASEPYHCVTFEDDSFACGTIVTDETGAWAVDTSKAWITGCVPGGICDEPTQPVPLRKHRAITPR